MIICFPGEYEHDSCSCPWPHCVLPGERPLTHSSNPRLALAIPVNYMLKRTDGTSIATRFFGTCDTESSEASSSVVCSKMIAL